MQSLGQVAYIFSFTFGEFCSLSEKALHWPCVEKAGILQILSVGLSTGDLLGGVEWETENLGPLPSNMTWIEHFKLLF